MPAGCWRRNLKPPGLWRSALQSMVSGSDISARSLRALRRVPAGPLIMARTPPPCFAWSPSPFRGGSCRQILEHQPGRRLGAADHAGNARARVRARADQIEVQDVVVTIMPAEPGALRQ